jgi:hypothetical protein
MKLTVALEALKGKGFTNLEGMGIDRYIEKARICDETARKVIRTGIGDVKGWQYHIDHEDDNFVVELNDGNFIIGTWYERTNGTKFRMKTYSTFRTEEQGNAAFEEWHVLDEAKKITEEMLANGQTELPRAILLLVVANELREAGKRADREFEALYG